MSFVKFQETTMRKHLAVLIVLLCNLYGTTIHAAGDTFSDSLLDRNKWNQLEGGIAIVNEKLELSVRTPTPADETSMNTVRFVTTPGAFNILQADVNQGAYSLPAGEDQDVEIYLAGVFYDSSGQDVLALITLKRKDGINNLSIKAELLYWDGADIDEVTFTLTTSPGDEVTLYLQYDGATTFTFRAGLAATFTTVFEQQTLNGPARTTDPTIDFKGLMYQNWIGEEVTNLVTAATFDNIRVDGAPYDNFDTPVYTGKPNVFLDPANWYQDSESPIGTPDFLRSPWTSRSINSGQLELTAQSSGMNKIKVDENVADNYLTDFFQADITIDPTSFASGTTKSTDRVQVQLYASMFNDTYDTPPYNGDEGAVYPMITLQTFEDGSTIAKAGMSRGNDVGGYDPLFPTKTLACTVTLGTPNTVSIEKKGKTFYFTCDDDTVSHAVTTPIYDGEYGKNNRIRARADASGSEFSYIKVLVDNAVTSKSSIINFIPVILSSGQDK